MGRDLISIWRNAHTAAYARRIFPHPTLANETSPALTLDTGVNGGAASSGD
jgi:hypothetical protein